MLITVHTPTYNRANLLKKAYQSLQEQTCFDFEWLITDDGSTDETCSMVEKWIAEEKNFSIRLLKLPHGGLIRALNVAVDNAKGEYYFRLDSDDLVTKNAVELITEKILQIKDNSEFVGVGFLAVYTDGKPIKGVLPAVNEQGYVDCTNLERALYNLDADMREAYKMEIMRQYPFPVWEGEMFAPEQLQMDAMALDGYKLRWFQDAIYIVEYQDDGLTKGSRDLLKKNKMGFAMLANQRMLYAKGLKRRFKAAGEHIALSVNGRNFKYIFKSNRPLLSIMAFPYGIILSIRRYFQFRK